MLRATACMGGCPFVICNMWQIGSDEELNYYDE